MRKRKAIGVFVAFQSAFSWCFNRRFRGTTKKMRQTTKQTSVTHGYSHCIGTMRFRLATNPFGNTFGLFCSSRVHPALMGNVFPTFRFPRVLPGTNVRQIQSSSNAEEICATIFLGGDGRIWSFEVPPQSCTRIDGDLTCSGCRGERHGEIVRSVTGC